MPQENIQDFDSTSFDSKGSTPSSHREGTMTRMIEHQTAKIPSGVFLGLAIGSMVTSLGLALVQGKSKGWANFVGQWAPSFLILGLYNKLVKVEGSDRTEGYRH